MNQKQLWEDLAKKNARYYINSDKGKGITEEQFRESGQQDVKELILNDNAIPLHTSILEIGCGNGRMTEFIAPHFDTVIGVDISGEMIRQGVERTKDIPNIYYFETDGESFPLPDETMDVVFSYIVFQHFKTKEMVEKNFKEVFRVLKPGGIFKVRLRTDEIASLEPWWSGVNYSEKEIKELCSVSHLKMIELEYVKSYAVWLWARK